MVRLCSKSSRSYSGRPVARACRQRQGRWSAMIIARGRSQQGRSTESNEPDNEETGRTRLTTREGPNLAARHDHRWSCFGSDEADWPSYRQRPSWQGKSAASIRKDCQEPPYADPHVRWCGRREGKHSRRPAWPRCLLGVRNALDFVSPHRDRVCPGGKC
jgi:hypothetical protein